MICTAKRAVKLNTSKKLYRHFSFYSFSRPVF